VIYVHVPFCRTFCTYCGFYSEICTWESGIVENYAAVLCREVEVRRDEIAAHAAGGRNTLYIGGGTPSVLPLSVLSQIVASINNAVSDGLTCDTQQTVATHGLVSGRGLALLGGMSEAKSEECHMQTAEKNWEEFTVEVNPDDIVRGGIEYAKGLKALGVTRVSMGVQSFDDMVLKWMNRRHSAAEAEHAFGLLREAGFDNISIDLIFGFGDKGADGNWEKSVSSAVAMGPEHISAYQLSIEPDSALEKMIASGRFEEADEELCRSQYDYLCKALGSAGYVHYEVSNFALPGREARHNSGYWDHSPYVGLGPAAHSFDGRVRSWNVSDVKQYIAGAERGSELLDEEQMAIEDVMLGLRTAAGVEAEHLRSLADGQALQTLLSEGALVELEGRFRIPADRFFVSDDIIARLL